MRCNRHMILTPGTLPCRTEKLCRFWSKNTEGFCLLPSCEGLQVVEDIEHMLSCCPSLNKARQVLVDFTINYSSGVPLLSDALLNFTNPYNPVFHQFILDCSSLPDVISLHQEHGQQVLNHLFKVTRTWCYTLHKERLKILGRWSPN